MTQLHILMIPLMSQSHMIPLTDFAKSLARRGALVSIVTTPLNARRYNPIIDGGQNLKIQMIPLRFPCREAGLPDGCENLDTLSSLDLAPEFFHACEMLKAPLQDLIRLLNPAPNCIISTSAISWTQELADSFNIPRYVFETVSCFTLYCSKKVHQVEESVDSDSEPFPVPGIPHQIEFTKNQLPRIPMKDSSVDEKKHRTLDSGYRGTLVNSFQELEPWYLERLREERGNVWSVGPVSLSNQEVSERFRRGNEASVDEHYCLTWLDSMKPKSVIYACFGSLCSLSLEQIKEIGIGLEESGFPFIWIIRKLESSSAGVEAWLAEERFEERVGGRGLVVRGWAPQVMILSHPSVGGFVTHCGWNSTLEGLCTGVPMITWPMFAEQFYNEKLIVNVLGVGVRVGVESCMPNQDMVERNRVKIAVKELMDESEEGRERRKRGEKLAEMASDAFEEGGSSFLNVTMFIQDVVRANIIST